MRTGVIHCQSNIAAAEAKQQPQVAGLSEQSRNHHEGVSTSASTAEVP